MLQLVVAGGDGVGGYHAVRHVARHAQPARVRQPGQRRHQRRLDGAIDLELRVPERGDLVDDRAPLRLVVDEQLGRPGEGPAAVDEPGQRQSRPEQGAVGVRFSTRDRLLDVVAEIARAGDAGGDVEEARRVAHVRVHVAKPRDERLAAAVDDLGTRRNRDLAVGPDRGDARTYHDDGLAVLEACTFDVGDRGVDEGKAMRRAMLGAPRDRGQTRARRLAVDVDELTRDRLPAVANGRHPRAARHERRAVGIEPHHDRRQIDPADGVLDDRASGAVGRHLLAPDLLDARAADRQQRQSVIGRAQKRSGQKARLAGHAVVARVEGAPRRRLAVLDVALPARASTGDLERLGDAVLVVVVPARLIRGDGAVGGEPDARVNLGAAPAIVVLVVVLARAVGGDGHRLRARHVVRHRDDVLDRRRRWSRRRGGQRERGGDEERERAGG